MDGNEFLEFGDILVLFLSFVSTDFVLLSLVLLELREVTSPVSELHALQVDHFVANGV
jgi:hypothetical protein